MRKRGQLILLWMLLIMCVSAQQLFSNPIQVYTREGADVTDSFSISTDHIHIIVPEFQSYTSASYKLYEGAEDPLSWGSIPSFEFYQDLYFYKQAFNQYIQISLTDTAGQLIEKQILLRGGELDGHTDDPILPVDLVARMGNGLIVEADVDRTDVDPEYNVIALKKAGIGHVRMHIGRLDISKTEQQDQNNTPNYYALIDRWVNEISRHGLYCHIGNKTNSVTEAVDGIDMDDPDFLDHFLPEIEAWWTDVAEHYKYTSHRLAFHIYLESGKINQLFGTDPQAIENLKNHYQAVSDSIRAVDPTRNIIFPPGSINNPERLKDLVFPESAGEYFLSDFHKGFAGGEWHPYEERYSLYINAALEWMAANGIPLIMSAVNANDRVNYPTVLRVEEIHQLIEDVNSSIFPVPITFLTLNEFWDHPTHRWYEDFDKRARFEAINGSGSINPEDPDGDFLTTEYELMHCGTDPHNPDTDRDNISDFAECLLEQMDPLNPEDGDDPDDLSLNGDYDGDGISNAIELQYSIADVANTSLIQTLDITDPTDSETTEFDTDKTPNVWEAILGFNLDDKTTRYLGGTEHDSDFDHDGDGISTIDEIRNNTWPIENYGSSGDRDRDYDLVGENDYMPFVNDSAYIIGYEFQRISENSIINQANQGSSNTGTLIGSNLSAKGVMVFDGKSIIDIPNNDFINLSQRTVHFHFMAEDTEQEQILYAEGNEKGGMSVGISGSEIIATAWSEDDGTMQEVYLSHMLEFKKWQAVTITFNGRRKEFALSLYKDNRPVSRTKIPLPFSSVLLMDSSHVSLGGSAENTRFYSPGNMSFISADEIYYNGYLDDFHVYNRALSETEVSLLSRNDLFPAKDLEIQGNYKFDVSIIGQGQVNLTPEMTEVGYATGTEVLLSAIPEAGWVFAGWLGDLEGNANPAEIVVSSNQSLQAVFRKVIGERWSTDTLFADTDAFVQFNKPEENFGTQNNMVIKSTPDLRFNRNGLIRFDLSELAGDIYEAELQLTCKEIADDPTAMLSVYSVENDNWIETEVNWNNAPGTKNFLDQVNNITKVGQVHKLDITNFAIKEQNGDKSMSLKLLDGNLKGDVFQVYAREDSLYYPKLLIRRADTASSTLVPQEMSYFVKVYPNPVDNILYLQRSPGANTDSEVKIVSMTGKICYSGQMKGQMLVIDTNMLQNGIYLLVVESPVCAFTKKIVLFHH